jgi:hypothetical protein
MEPSGAAAPPWYFLGCRGSEPRRESWPVEGLMINTCGGDGGRRE